jgi:hypothetical protein
MTIASRFMSVARMMGVTTAALAGAMLATAPSLAMAHPSARRLQGQVPLADQLSGRALKGYKNGIELVGHNNILNRLQNGNLGWVDDCAYVSAYFGSAFADNSGLAVLDASNPRKPMVTQIWPGTPGARESQVEGNQESRMVVVMPFPRATLFGDPAAPESLLQIYDTPPSNCQRLVKRGTYHFGLATSHDGVGQKVITHEHRIWKSIIYATTNNPEDPGPSLFVVDASTRDNPTLIATWDLADEQGGLMSGLHDIDISPDGTRVYGNVHVEGGHANSMGGLVILDTSEVANWKPGMPNPTIRRVGDFLLWTPPLTGISHTAQYFENNGHKYVAVANEGGGCPAGHAQIVDVTYELHPIVVSSMRLEANKPENCALTLPDHDGLVLGDRGGVDGLLMQYRYGAHYAGIDSVENGKLLAITWYSSGLHLFDVSDPYSPKHVGEFHPPARDNGTGRAVVDRTYSWVRFHRGNIWFTSANGGFWIVRHTPHSYSPNHHATPIN